MDPPAEHARIPWRNLDPEGIEAGLPRILDRERAAEWHLVLTARGIPTRLRPIADGWLMAVPESHWERARQELRQYREENRDWPPSLPDRPASGDIWASACVLAALALFHNLIRLNLPLPGSNYPLWLQAGNADVAAIRAGQWWRLATALTLHNDTVHLLSNVLIGGVFVIRLCREVGSGVGWCMVLLAGVAGNGLNCLIQAPDHRSLGASTAIFGAIGILAALNARRHRLHLLKIRPQRWLLPLAGALALLAMLGTGDERTDLLAHLCGFSSGLVVGWLAAPLPHAGARLNRLLGLGSALFVLLAWWLALR